MRIAVLSLTIGEKYKQITEYGRMSKIKYCVKHNYAFHDDEDILDSTRPIAWSKIKLIQKYISNYDYIVWMDGDTIIMNYDTNLEDFITQKMGGKDMMISQDSCNPCTGVWFIKSSEWSEIFLRRIYMEEQFINHPNWEQAAFIHLHKTNATNSIKHILILPVYEQHLFNAMWFMYQPGTFLLHFLATFRDGKDLHLQLFMNKFRSVQKEDESDFEFMSQLNWLHDGVMKWIQQSK